MNANDEFIFLCALRYALGRASYGPGIVMDTIAARWSEIGSQTRATMLRDLCEWLGSKPDRMAWPDEWRRWGAARWQRMTEDERAETVRQCGGSERAARALDVLARGPDAPAPNPSNL